MIFDLKKFVKSFSVALQGLKLAASEQTFRIFCLVGSLVIVLMIWLDVSLFEKLILILVIAIIMTFELINSRIERILDVLQPNYDEKVKVIKDISAGAVLLLCLAAAAIGILIFWPYLLEILP